MALPGWAEATRISNPTLHLPRTKQKIQGILAGEQHQLVVATIGDSWTANDNTNLGSHVWGKEVADTLRRRLGDAGQGWISFSNRSGRARGNINPEIISPAALSPGWVTSQTSDGHAPIASPDLSEVRSARTGATITISGTTQCNAINLFYKVIPGSAISYRINGTPATTLDTGSGNGVAALTGIPTGVWTLKIQVVAGEPILYGLDVKKNSGLRWHNIAAAGSTTAHWSRSAASLAWRKNLGALAPDLVTILLATNDQLDPVANFTTRMESLITSVRAAAPECEILLIAPSENGRPGRIPMGQFTEAVTELATRNGLPLLDLQPLFGATFADYEFNAPRPLFLADGAHPSRAGAKVISTAILHYLWDTPPGGEELSH